jgi:hypothetical protein
MFGMNNVPNLMMANGAFSSTADESYLQQQSEEASYLNKQQQAAEQKAADKAEEKKKAEADKATGVFSPSAENDWSAAGAMAEEAEHFLSLSPIYRFSAVA